MSNILKVRSEDDSLVVSGRIDLVKANRFAMMYLRDNLEYTLRDDCIVVDSYDSLHVALDDLKTVAEYADCEMVFSDDVQDDILDYQAEEEAFEEFSKKAKDIRENHPIISDFKAFEESIKSSMTRTLYPMQLLSAYHLCFSQNACNFSVPGAGKTSVVYGAYAYLHKLPADDPKHVDGLLIIGPLSAFGPWELEYEECFGRKVASMRLIGDVSKTSKELYLHGDEYCELTLTSYQSVPSIKEGLKAFLNRNRMMVVLDEAHKIKNTNGAIQASSVMELAQYAKARVVLTGTPAPNGYEDLYNLFKFIWPNKDVLKFSAAQLKNMTSSSYDSRVDDLMENIAPYYIRVKKSDLGIPAADYVTVPVTMDQSQRDIYDILEKRFIGPEGGLVTGNVISNLQKAKTIRLMQAATNPSLLKEPIAAFIDGDSFEGYESASDQLFLDRVVSYYNSETPAKYRKVAELCKEIIANGGKVVVWATFISNIHKLRDYLHSQGIEAKELYGATPVSVDDNTAATDIETRETIVKEFNNPNSDSKVIIANPFAVAESISLHKACHNAIYLERSFNAAHFMQSKDRIHRYGLPKDVKTTYYYLVSEDSVDETINERLRIKEDRMIEIIESMPIPLFDNALENEGLEDIKALIRDYESRSKTI